MIEGSIQKVGEGTTMANDTAKALTQIVDQVANVANLVNAIATASNEQATAVVQINQGIQQVSTVVQSNTATAVQSASASEELSSQAQLLREEVARFNLKNDPDTRARAGQPAAWNKRPKKAAPAKAAPAKAASAPVRRTRSTSKTFSP